jgi:hypothetical protein
VQLENFNLSRPILLLDIDGVLNPLCLRRPNGWDDFRQVEIGQYSLWLSNDMCNSIAALDATIVWCSTWCDDPDELIDLCREITGLFPLWLGRWGRAPLRWKTDLVEEALKLFSLVIWVDDDEQYPYSPPSNLLKITPRSLHGLQPEHIDEIELHIDLNRLDDA